MRKIVLFVFLVSIQCTQVEKPMSLLEEYYSIKEINELRRLTTFVEEQVTNGCEASTQECISQYFDDFKTVEASALLELNIDKDRQRKLMGDVDQDLFNDIWSSCTDRQGVKYLCVNSRGKFARMLRKISEANSELKPYGEAFFGANYFSPSMTGTLLKYSESFDFEYEPEFILAAIHLLTINLTEEPYYETL